MLVNHVTEYLDVGYFDLNPMVAGVLTIRLHLRGLLCSETSGARSWRCPRTARGRGGLRHDALAGVHAHPVPQMLRHASQAQATMARAAQEHAIVSMIGLSDMTWLADQAGRHHARAVPLLSPRVRALSGHDHCVVLAIGRLERRLSARRSAARSCDGLDGHHGQPGPVPLGGCG